MSSSEKSTKVVRESIVYRIRDLEADQRPRERLAKFGPSKLSDEQLLAILLRVGMEGENAVEMAGRLLITFKGLRGLFAAGFAELCNVKGLGPAKSAQLLAAIELGRRLAMEENHRIAIHSPKDVFDCLSQEMMMLDKEELWVIQLDTRNQILGKERVYRGSVNASQVRVGELFQTAVRSNATAVIVAHNHPSGDPTPSPEDVALTRVLIQAGKMLDIEVLDHIVIGLNKFVSLKEKNLAFNS